MIKKEDVRFLNQIGKSMLEAENMLEMYFREKDSEKLAKEKRFIMELQKKIAEITGE